MAIFLSKNKEATMAGVVSMDELAGVLTGVYEHLELGQVNDHAAYLLRFEGEGPWHRHTQDEMYIVIQGEVRIEFRNQPAAQLKQHDTLVVRAYTTHSASSEEGALVLMFKPKEMFAANDLVAG
jgi:mannose-6-phosphate isomerase-like protein (cupin superfamily)